MKVFICDHCGEIINTAPNFLYTNDCVFDWETKQNLGYNRCLCDGCMEKRKQLHAKLEKEFLHLE